MGAAARSRTAVRPAVARSLAAVHSLTAAAHSQEAPAAAQDNQVAGRTLNLAGAARLAPRALAAVGHSQAVGRR